MDQLFDNLHSLKQKQQINIQEQRQRSWIAADTWRLIDRRAYLRRRHVFGHISDSLDIPDCEELYDLDYHHLGKAIR